MMNKPLLISSLVFFNNPKKDMLKVIESFLSYKSNSKLFFIDNSDEDSKRELCKDSKLEYIFNKNNVGFGAAHNIAFDKAYQLNSDYHLLLNPDVYFKSSTIDGLIKKAFEILKFFWLKIQITIPFY